LVALRNNEADRFIASYSGGIAVWLIFGSDPGLIDERAQAIVKKSVDDVSDPFQLVRVSPDQLLDAPGALADEWNSFGLFNNRRVIRMDLGAKEVVDQVRFCLETPNATCSLVLRGGALKRDSAIRGLCERHKLAVSIECLSDSLADIKTLARREFANRHIEIDEASLDHLASALGADRRTTRHELDKLISFIGDEKQVTTEDIEAVVADAAPHLGDMAVAATLRGDLSGATMEAYRSASTPSEYVALLTSCLRISLLMHKAWSEIGNGVPRSVAFDKATRSVGPMRRLVQSAFEDCNQQSTLASINILRDAIGRTRRDPGLSEITTIRSLWSVSMRMGRR
jgi:DNA polymerase-3 subunit delta